MPFAVCSDSAIAHLTFDDSRGAYKGTPITLTIAPLSRVVQVHSQVRATSLSECRGMQMRLTLIFVLLLYYSASLEERYMGGLAHVGLLHVLSVPLYECEFTLRSKSQKDMSPSDVLRSTFSTTTFSG